MDEDPTIGFAAMPKMSWLQRLRWKLTAYRNSRAIDRLMQDPSRPVRFTVTEREDLNDWERRI